MNNFFAGLFVAIGLSILGMFVLESAKAFKNAERVVAVKGLSEREVPANTATWPITLKLVGNDIEQLTQEVEAQTATIMQFLYRQGFDANEVLESPPYIQDRRALDYVNTEKLTDRYLIKKNVTINTTKVNLVLASLKIVSELSKQGVAILMDPYDTSTKPVFLFTELNTIKPQMVEEATKNARMVAEKFAQDSQSQLGKIKTARQGQFSIYAKDNYTPHIKVVRVVTTLEYYLSD